MRVGNWTSAISVSSGSSGVGSTSLLSYQPFNPTRDCLAELAIVKLTIHKPNRAQGNDQRDDFYHR
jgi:hypothetical protein